MNLTFELVYEVLLWWIGRWTIGWFMFRGGGNELSWHESLLLGACAR